MNRDELGKRILFDRGEQSGGKGFFGLLHGGDPDFESGVKTYLLREQNKLIEQDLEEERQRQSERDKQERAQDAVEWLSWLQEYEKRWEPLTDSKNLEKLTDDERDSLYKTLKKVDNDHTSAWWDAKRADIEVGDVGQIITTVLRHLESMITKSIEEKRAKELGTLSKSTHDAIFFVKQINWSVSRYLDDGYHPPYSKSERPKHLKDCTQASIDAGNILLPVANQLTPETESVLKKHLNFSVKDIQQELVRGPQLAQAYYKAKEVNELRSKILWSVSISIIVLLLIFSSDAPWGVYLFLLIAPFVISNRYLQGNVEKTLKAWKEHLTKVGYYGTCATDAFMRIAGKAHPHAVQLRDIRVPDSPI